MVSLSLLARISPRQWIISGLALALGLFMLAFYLRGLEVRECRATMAAVEAFNQAQREQMAKAKERLEREAKKRQRQVDRTIRDIKNAPDNRAISGPMLSAIDGLCQMGAACQDTR